MTAIRAVDQALMDLCASLTQAQALLQAATTLMTPQERVPFQQLASKWGGTLASAHFGLDQYISLGPEAQHRHHRQPLEDFVTPFVGNYGWADAPQPQGKPEPQFLSEAEILNAKPTLPN